MLALLFPGQGSQVVGMGKALAERYPVAREVFQAADDALGFALSKLCWDGPQDELTLTANTQPAILTTSYAAFRVLEKERGVKPGAAVGHSLGEYSALAASGALGFADAVRTVRLRGQAMQEAVPPGQGSMAALLGLERGAVDALCAEVAQGEVVSAANLNGGGQVVVAGTKAAVERVIAAAKGKGAKRAVPLQVSAPFHCALMQPAADRLAAALAGVSLHPMTFPVVSNVDAQPNQDSGRVTSLLVQQVTSPVRFEECVQALAKLGVTRAVELGAGNVLAGLVKRIAPTITVQGVADPAGVEAFGGDA
jgi:[acyl-carrier-protein] S-malonyltransferase